MADVERAVAAVVCGLCLLVPAGLLLGGLLEAEEPDLGGGGVVKYVNGPKALPVKRTVLEYRVPVAKTGGRMGETSAHQMPVEESIGKAHHDAGVIPVESRQTRGIRPEPPPGE